MKTKMLLLIVLLTLITKSTPSIQLLDDGGYTVNSQYYCPAAPPELECNQQ